MEVVNKKGETIQTEFVTVTHTEFLKILKPFSHIRVGVGGGEFPFQYVYLRALKKDVADIVRMNQMFVTYSIMYNSKHNPKLKDTLYINKMKCSFDLDEPIDMNKYYEWEEDYINNRI